MMLRIDQQRVQKRFSEIRKRLRLLKGLLAEYDEAQFLINETIAAAAERHLQVTIQACLDIADHLIARLSLDLPKEDKKEVFPILAQNKIIPEALTPNLMAMAGMRNVLVHEYLEVQRQTIYDTIKNNLTDIEEFVTHIQLFLERHPG